jgi:uncharacterized protein (DUF58 family)
MTGRAFVLLLIAASTLYAARNVGVGWLYALGYALAAGVAASAAIGAWSLHGIRMKVAASRQAAGLQTEAGQPLFVAVTLENRGASPRRYLSLLAGPLGTRSRLWPWRRALVPEGWGTILIPELKPGERLTVHLPIPAPRRGVHALPAIYLQAAPLGLVACFKSWSGNSPTRHSRESGNPGQAPASRSRKLMQRLAPRFRGGDGWKSGGDGRKSGDDGDVMVHPRTHALSGAAVLDRRRGHGEREASTHLEDGGELAKSVRPYRSGDAMRQIHWKTTARTGQLSVRESEGDAPSQELVLLLDTAWEHDPESFELAVEVAASLLVQAQKQGMDVRLHGGGSEPQSGGPHDGEPQLPEPASQTLRGQLDWLALVSPGSASRSRAWERAVVITARPDAWEGRAEACLLVAPGMTIADVLKALT